ncbi:unnamed protein product [Wuchereria bancrofti]|uniref:Uncharacterized protein n=1 Tax=Wuchereria bancrofti TaxID=6293 RepID=A0A3P7DS70_WUCBA|nr:unnamed protein product [Wuchereria bancrofti]
MTRKMWSNRPNAINNSACMNMHAHARTYFKNEKDCQIISKILFQYVSFYSRPTLSSTFMAYTRLLYVSVTVYSSYIKHTQRKIQQCIFYTIRIEHIRLIWNLKSCCIRKKLDEPESEEYRGSDILAKITICKLMNIEVTDSSLLCLAFIGLSLSLKTNEAIKMAVNSLDDIFNNHVTNSDMFLEASFQFRYEL